MLRFIGEIGPTAGGEDHPFHCWTLPSPVSLLDIPDSSCSTIGLYKGKRLPPATTRFTVGHSRKRESVTPF